MHPAPNMTHPLPAASGQLSSLHRHLSAHPDERAIELRVQHLYGQKAIKFFPMAPQLSDLPAIAHAQFLDELPCLLGAAASGRHFPGNTILVDIPSKCATRLYTPGGLPPLLSPMADAVLAKCTSSPAADADIVSTICARNVSLRLTCHNRLPTSNRAWSQRRPPGPLWINGLSRPGVHEAVAHAIATNGTPHNRKLVPKNCEGGATSAI